MKNILLLITILIFALPMSSCGEDKDREAVTATVHTFMQAVCKPVDFKTIQAIYLDFPFYGVVRAEKYEILSLAGEADAMIATIYTTWQKHTGETISDEFLLRLEKREENWQVTNSKYFAYGKGITFENWETAVEKGLAHADDDLWDIEKKIIIDQVEKMNKE